MHPDQERALRRLQEELARPLEPLDWLFEFLALAGVLAAAWLAAANWAQLPDRFPVHFDLTGKPDRFGRPAELLELIGVQLALYAVLTAVLFIMPRLPARWVNAPMATEHNAPRLARILRLNLRGLKVVLTWLFTYIAWRSILVARGEAAGLGGGFIAAVLVVSEVHVIVLLWMMLRAGADSRR